jgi:hypothetical protein
MAGLLVVVVGVLMALGGAYMVGGWWGVMTALGFILVVLAWGEAMANDIVDQARRRWP